MTAEKLNKFTDLFVFMIYVLIFIDFNFYILIKYLTAYRVTCLEVRELHSLYIYFYICCAIVS